MNNDQSPYWLRGDTVVITKATLKEVRTRVKCVLIYSNIENATLYSLPWTKVANFISKRKIFCSYVPATPQSTTNYRVCSYCLPSLLYETQFALLGLKMKCGHEFFLWASKFEFKADFLLLYHLMFTTSEMALHCSSPPWMAFHKLGPRGELEVKKRHILRIITRPLYISVRSKVISFILGMTTGLANLIKGFKGSG